MCKSEFFEIIEPRRWAGSMADGNQDFLNPKNYETEEAPKYGDVIEFSATSPFGKDQP